VAKYSSEDVVSLLQQKELVTSATRGRHRRCEFWKVTWFDGTSSWSIVKGTQKRGTDWIPYGIQDSLIHFEHIDDVILYHKEWTGGFYRIPIADFRNFDTTISRGRWLFNISDGHIRSAGTVYPIPIFDFGRSFEDYLRALSRKKRNESQMASL
jgi:hypothetical protein